MSKNIAGAQINVHTCSRDMQLDLIFMSSHARVSISICSHTLESLPYIAYTLYEILTLCHIISVSRSPQIIYFHVTYTVFFSQAHFKRLINFISI